MRPLNIGEIFDRAITLYVRNLLPLSAVAAVLVVPLAVLSYFVLSWELPVWRSLLDQMQHPNRTAAIPSLSQSGFGWSMALTLVALFGRAIVFVAIAALVARIYRGDTADWRVALIAALRRLPGVLGLIAISMAIGFGGVLVAGISVGLVAALNALLLTYAAPLGVVMLIVTAAAVIAVMVLAGLLYLAIALAFIAVGAEDTPVFTALGSGFERVFNSRELLRATLLCLALAAVYIGLAIVGGGAGMIVTFVTFQPVLQTLVTAAINLVTVAFLGVLLCVYYFDVRTRREGLDVERSIDTLAVQSS